MKNLFFKRAFSLLAIVCMAFVAAFTLSACSSPELVGIEITSDPIKTTYIVGETFDPTGMVVTASYSNEKTKELDATEYTYSPTEALKLSNRKVTVTYEGFEDSVKISVTNDIENAVIKTHATKTEYVVGEVFDPTGLVVTVTRQNGDTEDVVVAESSAVTYSSDPLTQGQTTVELKAGDIVLYENITVLNGIFIEAETAEIVSTTVDINSDSPKASGGYYVGDLKAGNSITFFFAADKAGVADLEFIMSSTYLKADDNWSPIWMGDCQLNKLCDVYVNSALIPVGDDVILPGGGEEGGETNSELWFNWKSVLLQDVALVEGLNEVLLTFKTHDYTDTSQASFSGTFVPNIDSLKVVTSDVVITPVNTTITYTALSASIKDVEGVPTLVLKVSAEFDSNVFTTDDIIANLSSAAFDVQYNTTYNGDGSWETYLSEGAGVASFNATDNTFDLNVDISSLGNGGYVVHFDGGDYKISEEESALVHNTTVTIGSKVYTLFSYYGSSDAMEFWGCVSFLISDIATEEAA